MATPARNLKDLERVVIAYYTGGQIQMAGHIWRRVRRWNKKLAVPVGCVRAAGDDWPVVKRGGSWLLIVSAGEYTEQLRGVS